MGSLKLSLSARGYGKMIFSKLQINGSCPPGYVSGVDKSGQSAYSLSEYLGKYLVILFYSGDWEPLSQQLLLAFNTLHASFTVAGCEVVACSSDSPQVHRSWIKASSEEGGLGGSLNFPVWSDLSGQLASMFDLYDEEAGQCLEGVVILDGEGVVRHAMTTSMECEETAESSLELVKMLRAFTPTLTVKPVTVTDNMEKDWDKSRDPQTIKAMQEAKRLGRPEPPHLIYKPKNPTFDLPPTRIRRLVNPKAPIEYCSATIYRNIAGFGSGQNATTSHKIQVENIMKKVLGVNLMPEELAGEYRSFDSLTQPHLEKLFEKEIFLLAGHQDGGSLQFESGAGVYVNNYENFLVWVNKADHLQLVSAARGRDIKYVLLRLQKVIAKIEESLKSSQGKAFSFDQDGFVQQQREAGDGSGLDICFTLQLPGLSQLSRDEINQTLAESNMFLVSQTPSQAQFTVSLEKSPAYEECDIVSKSVEMVDNIWRKDQELLSQ